MTERIFTQSQAAEFLGVHRTTLLRMEDRGRIPKARWATIVMEQTKVRGRVYNMEEIEVIRKAIGDTSKTGGNDTSTVVDLRRK